MTTRIREYRWLINLRRLLNIDEGQAALPGRPGLSTTITPVLDVESCLRQSKVVNNPDVELTSQVIFTLYTVPDGVRQLIRSIAFQQTGGTWTIGILYIFDVSEGKYHAIQFYTTVTRGVWEPRVDVKLEPGDLIAIITDAHSVSGSISTTVLVDEEPWGPD